MNNKKTIMTFSAFLILFFHFWINIFPGNELESFLKQTSYVGVDIFFFISGYSLSKIEIVHYKDFVFSRLKKIYLKFIFFAIIAFIYKNWSIQHFLKVISGINLVQKGGGAFLWFLPFIVALYLVFPIFQKMHYRKPYITFFSILLFWLVTALYVSLFTNYRAMFIFWNRIPIFLFGFYLAKSRIFSKIISNKLFSLWTGIILICVGEILLLLTGYKTKLMYPITDIFYIFAMPTTIGLIFLLSLIPENTFSKKVGACTLEIYAIQMIFGYNLANKLLLLSMPTLVTNIILFALIIVISIAVNQLFEKFLKFSLYKQ